MSSSEDNFYCLVVVDRHELDAADDPFFRMIKDIYGTKHVYYTPRAGILTRSNVWRAYEHVFWGYKPTEDEWNAVRRLLPKAVQTVIETAQ